MVRERAFSDRFLIALLIAGLIHALVILGIHFELPKPAQSARPLSVTLVRAPDRPPPKKADVLAQENQVGSGPAEKKALPVPTPAPPPKPAPKPKPVPLPLPPPEPKPAPVKKAAPVVKPAPVEPSKPVEKPVERRPAPAKAPAPEAKRKPVLVQKQAERKIVADEGEEDAPKPEPPQPEASQPEPPPPEPPKISAALLSQQISEVSASLAAGRETETQGPRTLRINSVNAHKYKAAAYEHDWQEKIERIGNLNYPDEARRQNLSGYLVMAVHIRQDGSVEKIDIRQPSEHPVLDEAAERIVRLAEPFAPFPEEIKQQADILVITRTWRFYNGARMDTR